MVCLIRKGFLNIKISDSTKNREISGFPDVQIYFRLYKKKINTIYGKIFVAHIHGELPRLCSKSVTARHFNTAFAQA